jgi:hypothetical protein
VREDGGAVTRPPPQRLGIALARCLRLARGLRIAALAIAIAACSSPSPPPPPLTGHAAPDAPTSPEPTVAWVKRDIATTGLPAIAADGSSVVVAHRDNDGGRGNPNLTLVEKDRNDRTLKSHVVLTADDTDQLTSAQIEDRLRAATAWLRERHAARHLVPMTALTMSKPMGVPAVGAGVAVRWSPNQLVIERQGGSPITRATPATWLAPDHPMCRNCTEVCHNDAFLGAAYIDLERTLALIVVSYQGSDTCWEPSSQAHAVVW